MSKLRHAKLEPGDKLKLISRDTEVVVEVVSIERKPEDDCVVFIRIERVDDGADAVAMLDAHYSAR